MTTCLWKSCSFGLLRVPFVNGCQFMYLLFPFWFWGQDMGSDCFSFWSLLIFLLKISSVSSLSYSALPYLTQSYLHYSIKFYSILPTPHHYHLCLKYKIESYLCYSLSAQSIPHRCLICEISIATFEISYTWLLTSRNSKLLDNIGFLCL